MHEVSFVGIHWAKNGSSFTRRELRVGTEITGFHRKFKEFGKSKVSGLGSVYGTFYIFFYAPRGRDSSYFNLFSILGPIWLSFNALRGCLTN